MQNLDKLIYAEDNWETSLGYANPGVGGVFFGKNIATELNKLSWTGLVWFAVTGNFPDKNTVYIWDRVWAICTNYPDPRIWNNRIASLCGTTRSTASLAVAASTAVSEAQIYGRGVDIKAMSFLMDTRKKLDEGLVLESIVKEQLKNHKLIPGYGRPINPNDERVKPILEYSEKLGFSNRKYVRLALDIDRYIRSTRFKFFLNIGGLAAALAADMGLSPRQYIHFLTTCFSIGALACYRDSSEKNVGTLFPIRCDRIVFEGAVNRLW